MRRRHLFANGGKDMEITINTKGKVEGIDTVHGTVMLLMPDASLTIKKIKELKIKV